MQMKRLQRKKTEVRLRGIQLQEECLQLYEKGKCPFLDTIMLILQHILLVCTVIYKIAFSFGIPSYTHYAIKNFTGRISRRAKNKPGGNGAVFQDLCYTYLNIISNILT